MRIKKIVVAGSGLMGAGIAQVCAQAGYPVTMTDISDEILEKGVKAIKWSVSKLVEKKRIEGSVQEIMGRISSTTELSDAVDADFVFEAVFEDLEVKCDVFSRLDEICPSSTILASNTSAIPITEIAGATKRPDRVVGIHFFSPVPMMKVVEIIRGLATSDKTLEIATTLCQSLGKEIVEVKRDLAGFALNRVSIPSTVEAIRLVEAGMVSVEGLDKGMR